LELSCSKVRLYKLRDITESGKDFEMRPSEAAIMTMLLYMAYAVSLGSWRLMRGDDDSGLGKAVQVCPMEILDIMLELPHRPLNPSYTRLENCSKGGVIW
jgi:hypothetical protein